MDSLKDCDEIIIADGESTDKTIEIAKGLGVIVYSRNDTKIIPKQEDIDEFVSIFGYLPRFTTDSVFLNMSEIRNEVLTHAKNDWVFFPDADEFVTWNFDEIQKSIQSSDVIECDLIQTRDEKGNPIHWNRISKLFKKSKFQWSGKLHEAIVGTGNKLYVDSMKINHYKNPNSQKHVYESLEYTVLKDKDARSMFYLAREYFYYKEYKKSLEMFEKYIKVAWWRPEIAYAYMLMAKCCWQIERGDDSRKYCLQAIAINPDFKEALLDMSTYTEDGQKPYWKRYGEIATNENVIFK
jgi:glycosyltransferase involved in cell wall biosynthesis